MDGNKRNFFTKHANNLFKRKGVSRKGKWNNDNYDQFLENSHPADTLYRILCPSKKIGSVIGKGGNIVKGLREETRAKITVADSVHGSDERVIIIYSSPERISLKQSDDGSVAENEENLEPHCAAQDALLKVHSRIIEEDLFGGMASDDDKESNVVTARLLVPNSMVGCLLGKGGDVIQRLRNDTGASIRILPADHLPSCAMATDELVQISGKQDVAKRALYEVSTLLHRNRRKDKPSSFPIPYGGQNLHPSIGHRMDMLSPGNPIWPPREFASHSMPPMPWIGAYGNRPAGLGPGGFSGAPPGPGEELSAEFSMKILCAAGKIGGVIGKGGSNVKLVQQETGASIHVEEASAESDERVIRISAFEALRNPRSRTIDAILQIQNKTSEISEKGAITTRLLVPSSKVGCILGQGGHVINEMRRRTQADIRVYSKDDKPKCASDDEELVQISGNYGVAKDALAEIASRLRVRTLRDANAGLESGPSGPVQGLAPSRSLPTRASPLSVTVRETVRGGGQDYDHRNYPIPLPTTGSRYLNMNVGLDANISNNGMNAIVGTGGSNILDRVEVSAGRLKVQEPHKTSGSEIVEFRGSSEHLQGGFQSYIPSAGQNMNPHQGSYQSNMNSQQSSYQNLNIQESTYQSMNAQQGSYQSVSAYQNLDSHQSPYQNMITQQRPYPVTTHHGVYGNTAQGIYNIGAQQGAYQY